MEVIKMTPIEWRRARGLSIEYVAKQLGVHHVTWSKWENEPSKMPLGKADEFCNLIGVSQDQVSFLP